MTSTEPSAATVRGYRRDDVDAHPPLNTLAYRSTALRAPDRPLLPLRHTLSEITGPVYGDRPVGAADHNLTTGQGGEPLGERIIVCGQVLDGDGGPFRTSSWRSGRPTQRAAMPRPPTSIPPRSTPTSSARAAASPMPRAATGS